MIFNHRALIRPGSMGFNFFRGELCGSFNGEFAPPAINLMVLIIIFALLLLPFLM